MPDCHLLPALPSRTDPLEPRFSCQVPCNDLATRQVVWLGLAFGGFAAVVEMDQSAGCAVLQIGTARNTGPWLPRIVRSRSKTVRRFAASVSSGRTHQTYT